MKRKKQPIETSDEEPTSKRTRSAKETEVEDESVVMKAVPITRRPMRAANGVPEDDPAPEIADSVDGDEEEDLAEKEDSGEADVEDALEEEATPVKRRHETPKGTPSKGGTNGTAPSKLLGKKLFSTPVKHDGTSDTNTTPVLQRHADRSARRKSNRTLIERTVLGNASGNDEEDEAIAQYIYGYDDEEREFAQEDLDEEPSANAPTTPSKRGRPKGSKNRKRSPTPSQDLPPHELYFSQNRAGRAKTSNNNLSALKLLDHEEYFKLAREFKDPHVDDLEFRHELLAKSFNQWHFELSQDFNICLYGWGSKRSLMMKFATHIYKAQAQHSKRKIIIVNGYVHNLTIKDVLNTVAAAISERGTKIGSQPGEMLENLIAFLGEDPSKHITLIIHSIDGTALRRPTTQTILSRLSSLPQIHLVASADHPSFPLLWDSSLRSTFNLLFHDCTTFQPYTSELDVVDEVHELLGRSSRRVGGKEGVIFVLKSLPENARKLFKVLVAEQLAGMDETCNIGLGHADDDENDGRRVGASRATEPGVEWRVLYNKVEAEFICTSEMNFRTLLKEFYDHQMIQSRKDALGTEVISAPFRKEELENILEDIGF